MLICVNRNPSPFPCFRPGYLVVTRGTDRQVVLQLYYFEVIYVYINLHIYIFVMPQIENLDDEVIVMIYSLYSNCAGHFFVVH